MRIRLWFPISLRCRPPDRPAIPSGPDGWGAPAGALHDLVDAAALRLQVAEPVAAVKWLDGGSITDPARAAWCSKRGRRRRGGTPRRPGLRAGYLTDQIKRHRAIEYTRFAQWKFDPAGAPSAAPDQRVLRTQIDGYNRTMVEQICPALGFVAFTAVRHRPRGSPRLGGRGGGLDPLLTSRR